MTPHSTFLYIIPITVRSQVSIGSSSVLHADPAGNATETNYVHDGKLAI